MTSTNLRYLTGIEGFEGALLMCKNRSYVFTDYRYLEEARLHMDGPIIDHEGHLKECLLDTIQQEGLDTLRFEKSISWDRHREFSEYFGEHQLVFLPGDPLAEDARTVKDLGELTAIRQSAEINNRIFEQILEELKPGVRETEIKRKLEISLRELGGRDSSFDLIVLFGAGTSLPHGQAGGRVLEQGMPVLLDMGVNCDGYASDMTRMVFMGKPPSAFMDSYRFVLETQEEALSMVKDGIGAKDIDKRVRERFGEHGYELKHSTGHGVGLEIHERPFLGPRSTEILRTDMVITIEPGLYLKDGYGIRIEDLVIVQDEGCEVLTKPTKELIVL